MAKKIKNVDKTHMTTDDLRIPKASKESSEPHAALIVVAKIVTAIMFIASIPLMFLTTMFIVIPMVIVFFVLLITFPFAALIKRAKFKTYVWKPANKMDKYIELLSYEIAKFIEITYCLIARSKFDSKKFEEKYFK